jgi:hypothetical protein
MEKDQLNESVAKAQDGLRRLDEEYVSLTSAEDELIIVLERLKKEEACLREALELAKETGAERRSRQQKAQDEQAIARLEEALMMGDDNDEESSSGGGNLDPSVFSLDQSAAMSAVSRKSK